MKKIFVSLLKYTVIFCATILLFLSFNICSSLLPNYRIKENIKKSVPIFQRDKEDLSEHIIQKDKYFAFDDFAEIYILMYNYNIDRAEPLKSALLTKTVSWGQNFYRHEDLANLVSEDNNQELKIEANYWNGNTFLLRFLLILGDYNLIRWIYWAVSSSLLLIFMLLIYKKTDFKIPIFFLISLLAVNFFTTQFSMQLSIGFNIAWFFSIIILHLPQKKNYLLPYLFFIFGLLTQYMDFNTVPVISITIPLITYIILNNTQSFKHLFLKTMQFSFLWCLAFLLCWVAKWGLATILTDYNSFEAAFLQMNIRHSFSSGKDSFVFADIVKRQFYGLHYSFLLGVFAIMFILSVLSFKKQGIKIAIIFLCIAITPFLYYLILPQGVYTHYWFMYRIQATTILSILLVFYYLTDWEKLILKTKKIFKKNI